MFSWIYFFLFIGIHFSHFPAGLIFCNICLVYLLKYTGRYFIIKLNVMVWSTRNDRVMVTIQGDIIILIECFSNQIIFLRSMTGHCTAMAGVEEWNHWSDHFREKIHFWGRWVVNGVKLFKKKDTWD